nr:hypothetical protein [Pandoravirus massiliensis]
MTSTTARSSRRAIVPRGLEACARDAPPVAPARLRRLVALPLCLPPLPAVDSDEEEEEDMCLYWAPIVAPVLSLSVSRCCSFLPFSPGRLFLSTPMPRCCVAGGRAFA